MKLTQLGRSLQAHIGKPILGMLFILTVSLPNAFAQDYTQWHLPDGAKARLGRGAITGSDGMVNVQDLVRIASYFEQD